MMDMFHGPPLWVIGASAIGGLLLVAAIIVAARGARAAAILIVAGIALPVLVHSLVIDQAVAGFRAAIEGEDPSVKATGLAGSLSTGLNSAAIIGLALVAMSWVVAIAAALIVRKRGLSAVFLAIGSGGAVAVAGIGLCLYAIRVIRTFSAVAFAEPSMKALILSEGMAEARPFLDGSLIAAAAIATLLSILAAIVRLRSEDTGGSWALPIAVAPCAILLALFAVPFAREAWEEPLPFSATGEVVYATPGIETPELRGPDPVERAPTITLSSDRASIEGVAVTVGEDLADKLREMMKIDEMMHPGQPVRGTVLLMCDRRTPGARVKALLADVRSSGFREAVIVFHRTKTFDRPLLGRLTASGASGARLSLIASEGSTALAFEETDTCESIAARLVDLRKKDLAVHLSD